MLLYCKAVIVFGHSLPMPVDGTFLAWLKTSAVGQKQSNVCGEVRYLVDGTDRRTTSHDTVVHIATNGSVAALC
jgi:hypothetical protein